MKKYSISLLLLITLLIIPFSSAYAAFQKTEGFYIITEDEVIDDNVYVLAESVDISGTIKGDLIIAAGSVNLNGIVEGDVIVVSGDATIGGVILGDIRIISGNIQIDAEVSGNVMGASGELDVTDETSIGHSLTMATGILKMNGSVAKNVRAVGGLMTINGSVGNDVSLRTDKEGGVILGSNSRIGGDVHYSSAKEIQRISGAEVAGVIQRIEIVGEKEDSGGVYAGIITYKIFSLLMLIVVGLLFIHFFPNISKDFRKKFQAQVGMTLLYGFALFFLLPIISILLAITVIGLPLALIAMTIYLIALYLTHVVVAITVGTIVAQKITKKNDTKIAYSFLLGALIISILTIIPVFGQILALLLLWWGLGILFVVIHKVYIGQKG